MQQALALASKNGSRYARALVEVVIAQMLEAQGHATLARALAASSRTASDDELISTLRSIVETGPKLAYPHALLSAAFAIDDARRGHPIDGEAGCADMALRRAVAGGAPIESVERLIAQLNAAA